MNTHESSTVKPIAKKAYTVEEIQLMLGIGKNSAYKLAHSGEFQILKIGTAIRISKSSFDSWLNKQAQKYQEENHGFY